MQSPDADGTRSDPELFVRKHIDGVLAAVCASAAAVLYATTFSSRVAFGDSPESIAGVADLGVLHAPGYPSYVLTARAFGEIVRVGDWAFRVNLFSAVTSCLAVALTYFAGRRLGAGRLGAVIGAVVLASSTSVWFYATYAKFYGLTIALVVGAVLTALRWVDGGSHRWLFATGALIGLIAGASWQSGLLIVPGLVLLVLLDRRPYSLWGWLAPMVGFVVTSAVLWGFVMLRAASDPAISWGGADSLGRLLRLVSMEDFGLGARVVAQAGGEGRRGSAIEPFADAWNLARAFSYEFSALVLVAAAAGLIGAARRTWGRFALLAGALAINAGAVVFVLGLGGRSGFGTNVRYGGFLLAAVVSMALLAGVGATQLFELGAKALTPIGVRAAHRRPGQPVPVQPPRWYVPVAGVGLIAALVLPPVVAHRSPADQAGPSYAEDYAHNVLEPLPQNAVLVVWGAERAFPLQHAQVVEGTRDDIEVVVGNQLIWAWYREQVAERVAVDLAGSVPEDPRVVAAAFVQRLVETGRTVHMDTATALTLRGVAGSKPVGLTAAATGDRDVSPPSTTEGERLLSRTYRTTGIYDDPQRTQWPNRDFLVPYVIAHLQLSDAYAAAKDYDAAERHLLLAQEVDPTRPDIPGFLEQLEELRATG